jgi:hypothetical protein
VSIFFHSCFAACSVNKLQNKNGRKYTEQAAKQESEKTLTIAQNNGFPEQIIYRLRKNC